MSAKKQQQTQRPGVEARVDPAAVVLLSRQVRDYLMYHRHMGVESYPAGDELKGFLKEKNKCSLPRRPGRTTVPVNRAAQTAGSSLAIVNQEITDCRLCTLATNRCGQVKGTGSESPKLLVVGDWCRQEEPFSGAILFGREEDAMLKRMVEAIGLTWEEVYVSNVIKCCPLNPLADKDCARQCFAYLGREIALLQPSLVLAMGEIATAQLLGTTVPLVRLRGRFHPYLAAKSLRTRVMPTFHPRFLMKNPEMKQMVWQDLQLLQRQLSSLD